MQHDGLAKGVGIDTTKVAEVSRLLELSDAFLRHTYTEAERAEAERHYGNDRLGYVEYLAGRYAVKEAVFKAVAHLTARQTFDFRLVETLATAGGCPTVTTEGALAPILADAGVTQVLVSITTEAGLATAIAVAL